MMQVGKCNHCGVWGNPDDLELHHWNNIVGGPEGFNKCTGNSYTLYDTKDADVSPETVIDIIASEMASTGWFSGSKTTGREVVKKVLEIRQEML